jgi:hypothetical protein
MNIYCHIVSGHAILATMQRRNQSFVYSLENRSYIGQSDIE